MMQRKWRRDWKRTAAATTMLLLSVWATAYAMPQGGQISAGTGMIVQNGANMVLTQATDNMIINWQSFGIAGHEKVNFVQPSSSSVALNRVLGNEASQIYGQLNANGRVFLLNPNGLLFAPGAEVNVGGIVASTMNLKDQDFLAGKYHFVQGTGDGKVLNQGRMQTAQGGFAALLGQEVRNTGVIAAKQGTVVLGAGNQVTLDFNGNGMLSLAVDQGALHALIENKGMIQADGGMVLLSSKAAGELVSTVINNEGIIRARSVHKEQGVIIFDGSTSGVVTNSASLDVSGRQEGEQGGTVKVLGEKVGLFAGSTIEADGDVKGGTVLVGGNYQGQGPEANAKMAHVAADTTITANALTKGDGGKVVIWSDDNTRVYGQLEAKGGIAGGNGGLVETSGHYLDVQAAPNVGAPMGNAGTWLLDPYSININNTRTSGVSTPSPFIPTTDPGILSFVILINALKTGSVIVQTADSGSGHGDIQLQSDFDFNGIGHNQTLTLNAHGDIYLIGSVYDSIAGGESLNLVCHPGFQGASGMATYLMNSIRTGGGSATFYNDTKVTTTGSVTVQDPVEKLLSTSGGAIDIKGNLVLHTDVGNVVTIDSGGGNISIDGKVTAENFANSFVSASKAVRGDIGFYTEGSLAASDGGSSPQINIGFGINLFGTSYAKLYVNNNGNLTFDGTLDKYTPLSLDQMGRPIIAPFWADVDTRGSGSSTVKYGTSAVRGHKAFGVNYVNVGYYNSHSTTKNSFQVVLIDRADTGTGNFDMEFNYDKVQWETGDDSGGHSGLGGTSASIGFSNGSNVAYEFAGSRVNGAFLDSNNTGKTVNGGTVTGLIYDSLNSPVLGSYVMQVRNGNVNTAALNGINLNAGAGRINVQQIGTGTDINKVVLTGNGGVTLNGNITTADAKDNGILITGPAILAHDVVLTSGTTQNGPISFSGTINGPYSLTVDAGSLGKATFNSDIGQSDALTKLKVTSAETILHKVRTSQTQTYQGEVTLNGSLSGNGLVLNTGGTVSANNLLLDAGTGLLSIAASGLSLGSYHTILSGAQLNISGNLTGNGANLDIASSGSADLLLPGISLGNGVLTVTAVGHVTQSGAIAAQQLALLGSGNFVLTHVNNAVTTLAANVGSVAYEQAKALNIGTVNSTVGILAANSVLVHTTDDDGDLTLTKSITADGTGNAVVLASGRDFINQAGTNPFVVKNGRYLVYSVNPAQNTFDGFVSPGNAFGRLYAKQAPDSMSINDLTGSRMIYSVSPNLTVTANGISKEYGDMLPALSYTVTGLIAGDSADDALMGFLATDAQQYSNVGQYNITKGSLTASNLGYTLQYVGNNITIAAAPLTITTAANSKVYDGVLNAAAVPVVQGLKREADVVTNLQEAYLDKNVGVGKTLRVLPGYTVQDGNGGNNYSVTVKDSADGQITQRDITVSANVTDKIYDGKTGAAVQYTDNRIAGDGLTITGSAAYSDKNAGTGKTVKVTNLQLAGQDAANYHLGSDEFDTTGDITPRNLHVMANAGASKVYDGKRDIQMTYSDDRIEHDDLKISGSAAYEDKNVGQGKTILVSGIRLDGDDAKNYTLVSATTRTTGDITARDLHVTAKVINGGSKVYDGTAAAQVSFGDDRVEQDAFDVSGAASYRDKNVGEAKSVDVTDIGISGADAGNYKLVNKVASTTADIAARPLIIRAVENKKTYDGKTTANVLPTIEGLQGSDRVSDLVEVYTDADAGREKALVVAKYKLSDGNEGNNYLVQTIDCQKGVIEKAELTYVADYKERYVGEGNPVLTGTVTGFIPGETLESATTGQMVFITDAAASSPAGSYAVYGSGLKAKNYEFKQMSANQQALLVKKTVWQQTPATDAGQENTQSTQKKAATQDKLSGLAILQVLGDGSSGAAGNSVQGSKSRNEYSRDGSRDNENTTRRKVEKGNTLSHRKHNAGAGSGITFVHYNGRMSEITLIENTTGKFTLTDNMGIQDKNHGTEGVVKKISAFQVNHGKVQQHPIYTVSVKDNELSLMAAAQPPVIPDMVQTAEIKSTYVEINLGEDHMYSYHIGFNGHSLHIAPQNDNAVRRIAETASDGNKQIVAVAVLGALQDMELSLAQIEEVYIQVK